MKLQSHQCLPSAKQAKNTSRAGHGGTRPREASRSIPEDVNAARRTVEPVQTPHGPSREAFQAQRQLVAVPRFNSEAGGEF